MNNVFIEETQNLLVCFGHWNGTCMAFLLPFNFCLPELSIEMLQCDATFAWVEFMFIQIGWCMGKNFSISLQLWKFMEKNEQCLSFNGCTKMSKRSVWCLTMGQCFKQKQVAFEISFKQRDIGVRVVCFWKTGTIQHSTCGKCKWKEFLACQCTKQEMMTRRTPMVHWCPHVDCCSC